MLNTQRTYITWKKSFFNYRRLKPYDQSHRTLNKALLPCFLWENLIDMHAFNKLLWLMENPGSFVTNGGPGYLHS